MAMGFKNVSALKGGFDAWKKEAASSKSRKRTA